jgi:hypothetical protein
VDVFLPMTIPQAMKEIFKFNTGLPYYINHVIIALIIGASFGIFTVGAVYYVGREMRDWEKLGYFDHKGFWWPVVVCSVADILRRMIV